MSPNLMKFMKLGALDVTKPYTFIWFGAIYVTKPYKCIWFGAIHVTKPYKFIWFGAIDVTKPYNFIKLVAIDVTRPYKFIRFGEAEAQSRRMWFEFRYAVLSGAGDPIAGRIPPYWSYGEDDPGQKGK
jgi:hypothetical protein